MTTFRLSLSVAILFVASAANAAVFMQEAASVSGYGPTRVGYSMYYAGACGERIGAEVGYVGRTPIEEALPDVLQYARNSAVHLVARCPQVETIEVAAQGGASSPRRFYRFEMHRSDDWAPTNVALNTDIVAGLLAADFLPATGPIQTRTPSFAKFRDGRLDIVYGNNFEYRMVSTHVEQVMQPGSEPARLSHYMVRGHWFGLGNEQPNGSCEQSRDGYPLWGSFAMTLSPFANDTPVQFKPCAEDEEEAVSERASIGDLRIGDFEDYGKEPYRIAAVLAEAIEAAGNFAAGSDPAEFARTRQPIYESDRQASRTCARTGVSTRYTA